MTVVKHIMFDFDGTIADTSAGIINSMHYAFDKLGIKRKNDEKIRNTIGPPLEQMFEMLLESNDGVLINKGVKLFRERYAERGVDELFLYKGVRETLSELYLADKKLYIVTSKPEDFVIKICQKQDIFKYFTGFTGVSKTKISPSKTERMRMLMDKYTINAECSIMVGDGLPDAAAASANNVECIGALYGFGTQQQLVSKGCKKFINCFSELLDYVEL